MKKELKQKIKIIGLNAQRQVCNVMKVHNIPAGTEQGEGIELLSETIKLGLGQ